MANKPRRRCESRAIAVTPERARRLYRLLRLLSQGPQTRPRLVRRLRLDLRGFYRDLKMLRAAGIAVSLEGGHYVLAERVDAATARLPFPDPHLTLGEARQLARGRTLVHRKLARQINQVFG
jgi:predicted DNA-binding transcriptional regulator YafY